MSATATIAITVGVAVAVLVGFFIIYYLGNVANSIYDVKVGVRKDFEKKIKELQDWVDKDTKQRINWMRDENKEDGKRFKESVEGHLDETFVELRKEVERLRADVSSLQMQMQNLQAGKGIRQSVAPVVDGPVLQRPKMNQETSLGDLEVPKFDIPDQEMAPDMAVPKDGARAATKDKPSPLPKKQGTPVPKKATVEGAQKKKRKVARDEFESFDQFSEDFKAGS